jgi:flavodoxin
MKALVVYDSVFGNTERVARAVGEALDRSGDVEVLRVSKVSPEQLKRYDILIVGSPTRAFQPTGGTKKFLNRIPAGGLKGIRVAAFDTRLSVADTDSGLLVYLVRLFGYAAEPMADKLKKKGGDLAVPPEGFIVEGTEGPLREGELERAADWARQIRSAE